ncbi:Hypothetical protein VV2_1194 [Vibrio vulnificus CMCP6]|uniref:Uncharacterized protein n=1 Tax=Vibrio vulnificus (strain CMCP6) TaxID=216895 RepID=A0A3Q0KZX3_VIBVU|nr:Hypothetical protein VV2_1194 [Vibrio vulnificus CMCP6]
MPRGRRDNGERSKASALYRSVSDGENGYLQRASKTKCLQCKLRKQKRRAASLPLSLLFCCVCNGC